MQFSKRGYLLTASMFFLLSLIVVHETTVNGDYSRDIFMSGHAPTIPAPDEKYSPEMATLKVEEKFTYEVAIPEEKLSKGEISPEDLELIEVKNKSEIIFHQVECFYYRPVIQRQTRTTDVMVCNRTRKGTEYWLTDKTRFVEWEEWSDWVSLPKKGVAKKD